MNKILLVVEADVARIVPRVISHHVRMSDSRMDEVLAGAVGRATFFMDKNARFAKGTERKPGQNGIEVGIGQRLRMNWSGFCRRCEL